MKLHTIAANPSLDKIRIKEIEDLLLQPDYRALRPCADCDAPCACSDSVSCACNCGPDCEHAPLWLSSDPDRYPIEENIAPLVFGFNCLRLCPPYWSCEGHEFPGGGLFRVPQVWFYSRSLIYPKLIADYIIKLKLADALTYHWHICLAYAESSLETGFSIEPDIKSIENPDLRVMQDDIRIIADNFVAGIKAIALEYLEKYNQEMPSS